MGRLRAQYTKRPTGRNVHTASWFEAMSMILWSKRDVRVCLRLLLNGSLSTFEGSDNLEKNVFVE